MRKSARELIHCQMPFSNNWLRLHGYAMVRNGGAWGWKFKKKKNIRTPLPFK